MKTITYIATIPMTTESEVLMQKALLVQIFGWVVLRGRHKDRKKVLGNRWRKWAQNDVPWRLADRIEVYLHPKNPNYERVFKGLGIKRVNFTK